MLRLGGYRLQAREEDAQRRLAADALALVEAGISALVLECVPSELARRLARELPVPVIGIGAGPGCDGQILVSYDLLGISPGRRPRFCRDFLAGRGSVSRPSRPTCGRSRRVISQRGGDPRMSLTVLRTRDELSAFLRRLRSTGASLALVPTMGNLHRGHLALVERAAKLAERVAVSIFVNPTQFGPEEDFDRYPRTPEQDLAALSTVPCDLVFMPPVEEMYPFGIPSAVRVRVPGLSEVLCGERRPGHFDGVATVVLRLLTLFDPEVAVFGEKDYQQLLLVRRLVADLGLPVRIEGVPTVRTAMGLPSVRAMRISMPRTGRAPCCSIASFGGWGSAGWRGRSASASSGKRSMRFERAASSPNTR